MRPTQTKPLPPESDERGLPMKDLNADGFKNESQSIFSLTQQETAAEVPTRPTSTGNGPPERVAPEAEAIELYWASGLGRDEYGCPTYHLIAVIRCPHCRKTHTHGLGVGYARTPTSGTGGHRVAHCGPRVSNSLDTSTGYYITGLNQVAVPEYPSARCRALRGAPAGDDA